MNATFYTNTDDKRKISKNPQPIFTTEIKIKDDTTLLNPTLILKNGSNYLTNNINYVFIDGFNRFYFIDDITFSQQHIFVSCSVDVLMSFQTEILALDAIIKRQENLYSGYLNDNMMIKNQYNNTVLKAFNSPFRKALEFIIVVGG